MNGTFQFLLSLDINMIITIARAEEELGATSNIKMTNHSNLSSSDGPDSLNAATYISVVSVRLSPLSRFVFRSIFVYANFIILFLFRFAIVCFVYASKCMHFKHQSFRVVTN